VYIYFIGRLLHYWSGVYDERAAHTSFEKFLFYSAWTCYVISLPASIPMCIVRSLSVKRIYYRHLLDLYRMRQLAYLCKHSDAYRRQELKIPEDEDFDFDSWLDWEYSKMHIGRNDSLEPLEVPSKWNI
jgi:hypothetical protein